MGYNGCIPLTHGWNSIYTCVRYTEYSLFWDTMQDIWIFFGYCHASKISIHSYRIWAHVAIEVAVSAIYGLVFEFLGKMVFQNSCYDHVGYSGCIVTAVIIINHSIAVLIRYVVIITLVHSQIFLYSMISLYYSWIWVSLGL